MVSITITTDVFCDGNDCGQWVDGATGMKSRAAAARKEAKRRGWKITRRADLCPVCRKTTTEGEGR